MLLWAACLRVCLYVYVCVCMCVSGVSGVSACVVCVCVCHVCVLCVRECVCVDVRVLCTYVPFVVPFGYECASLKVQVGVSTLCFVRLLCSRVP